METNVARCAACGLPIRWALSSYGEPFALDEAPCADGDGAGLGFLINSRIVWKSGRACERLMGGHFYANHLVSCKGVKRAS